MLLVMVMDMYLYEVPASTQSTGSMKDLPFFIPSVLSDSPYPLSVAIVGLLLGQTIYSWGYNYLYLE